MVVTFDVFVVGTLLELSPYLLPSSPRSITRFLLGSLGFSRPTVGVGIPLSTSDRIDWVTDVMSIRSTLTLVAPRLLAVKSQAVTDTLYRPGITPANVASCVLALCRIASTKVEVDRAVVELWLATFETVTDGVDTLSLETIFIAT